MKAKRIFSVVVAIAGAACLLATRLHAQSAGPEAGAKPNVLANSRPPFLTYVKVNRPDGVFEEGDHLRIEFLAQRQAFLYLLYHQADGRTLLLFPNSAVPDNDIPGRRVVRIPGPEQPFGIRIRPPFGKEAVQVVACRQRVPQLDAILARRQTQPVISPQVLNQLAVGLKAKNALWAEHRLPLETVPAGARSDPKPVRVGLFIGIGEYQNSHVAHSHEELRHSAEVMCESMLRLGKLDPKNTKLVVNREATRSNLEELICHWLPQVSHPGDTVFIYFSGHAGQLQIDPHDETAGRISIIGPYDIEGGKKEEEENARLLETSIASDSLSRWLENLAGRQVVLILDTCHSGGMLEPVKSRFFTDKIGQLNDIAQMNVVLLTSCARDEEAAFEDSPHKTMWFTHFLVESMEKLPAPLTLGTSFQYAQNGMLKFNAAMNSARGEVRRQDPQMSDTALLPIQLVP